jgi:hypothetical protein
MKRDAFDKKNLLTDVDIADLVEHNMRLEFWRGTRAVKGTRL